MREVPELEQAERGRGGFSTKEQEGKFIVGPS